MGLQMQLQYLDSEAPRFYVHQETLLSQGINPRRLGEVSTGLQLSHAWPFTLSHLRVSRTKTKRSSWGGLQYSQHHSSHQLQHIRHLLQSDGFPQRRDGAATSLHYFHPLDQASPRHGRMTSSDSRHSAASLFASSSFNLPGYPSVGLGSLTPLVPSIACSHHVPSTLPPNLFPSRPSTPWLTIDQANSIFGLASECQALGVRLAKDFQVLSGLEAIHRNSVQGTAHETLTLGCSAREAVYAAILWNDITEAECEAMTHRLCSEADATWKKMHEVMYNHQLEYDQWLADFQGGRNDTS